MEYFERKEKLLKEKITIRLNRKLLEKIKSSEECISKTMRNALTEYLKQKGVLE